MGAVGDGWEHGFPQVVTPELVEQLKAFQVPPGPLRTGIPILWGCRAVARFAGLVALGLGVGSEYSVGVCSNTRAVCAVVPVHCLSCAVSFEWLSSCSA